MTFMGSKVIISTSMALNPTRTALPSLPLDVIWHIFYIIALDARYDDRTWETYRILSACALTCSDWLPGAQCNLYDFVWIRRNGIQRFIRTILTCPHLASFVREVRYSPFRSYDSRTHRSVTSKPLAEDVIRHLVHLRSFAFDGAAFHSREAHESTTTLLALRHCPELATIIFHNWIFPSPRILEAVIHTFSHTQSLCTWRFSIGRWGGAWPSHIEMLGDQEPDAFLHPLKLEVSHACDPMYHVYSS